MSKTFDIYSDRVLCKKEINNRSVTNPKQRKIVSYGAAQATYEEMWIPQVKECLFWDSIIQVEPKQADGQHWYEKKGIKVQMQNTSSVVFY